MGRVREHLDPLGKVTHYLHDPAGDLQRSIPNAGSDDSWSRNCEYDGVKYRYDAAGNLVERTDRIAEVAAERRTIVLYEAPHRVARTVTDLAAACGQSRMVALTRELTKLHEEVLRGTATEGQGILGARASVKAEITRVVAPPEKHRSGAPSTAAPHAASIRITAIVPTGP